MSNDSEINRTQILKLRKNDNNKCADCSNSGTTYIDIKFGCFLCTRCAGLHRKLGTDISRIKSISFDTFKDVDVIFIKTVGGNDKFNNIYEAKPMFSSPKITPKSDDNYSYEYIVKKYVKKLFNDESKKIEIKREISKKKVIKQNDLVPITQIVSKFIESNKDTEVIETNKIGVEHNINSLDDKLTKTLPVAIEPTQNTSDILSDLLDIFVTPVESNQNPILPVGIFDDPPQKIILDTTPKPPPKKSYEDIKQDIMKMYYMRY